MTVATVLATPVVETFPITILLVDDQSIIAEAVRRMLQDQQDITLHYCSDPTEALQMAEDLHPTLILQDIVMPEIDGLTLVKYYRANPALKDIPVVMLSTKEEPTTKAEAFANGANDYLVKLPDHVELVARIRYHSKSYTRLLQRNLAYQKIEESHRVLQDELNQAANYAISLLPKYLKGDIDAVWRFVPSEQLGGDSLGYHWIDNDHFAFYLLDVCGHGVGAALLSITAMDVLRGRSLPANYLDPEDVLYKLNNNFQMEDHNNMFFTICYGVINKVTKQVVCASAGHPPPVVVHTEADGKKTLTTLTEGGVVIGAMPDLKFKSQTHQLTTGDVIYVFSDGLYELTKADETVLAMSEYIKVLATPPQKDIEEVDRFIAYSKEIVRGAPFDDDVSLFQLIINC